MFVQTNNTALQAVKYVFFAGMAAFTNIVSRYILSNSFLINYYISISIAYVLGLFVNFFLNSNYNFPKSHRSQNQVLQTFFVIGFGGLLLTECLSHLILYFLNTNLPNDYTQESIQTYSHIISVMLVFAYSFFAHKYFTYKEGVLKAFKSN